MVTGFYVPVGDPPATETDGLPGALILAVAVVQGAFNYFQRMTLVAVSREIEFDLRNEFFSHLERLHLGFFQRSFTGDLMARATNDLAAVRMLCGPAIMYSSQTLFVATGALLAMAQIHGRLTLLALCTLPLIAVATKSIGERIHHLFGRVQALFAQLSARAPPLSLARARTRSAGGLASLRREPRRRPSEISTGSMSRRIAA